MLIVIAFLGYVLPWGQMSYWGATVITNVLSFIPDIVEWICGSFFVYNPTLNRFFVLHFILPFLVMCLLLFHIFYLHLLGSSNPLGSINTNNKVTFFSYILNKDIYGFLILFTLYCMQLGYGLLLVSHPDNALEVNILVTPFHIVPEWYFLSFYAKLKTIPDKNSGICILIITILLFFMSDSFGFVINNFNLGISIYFFFWICFIWISTEIPKVNFICLCRYYIYWYLFIVFNYLLFIMKHILSYVRARASH
jgi:ubiquinol-cytochrome c reductase cytochrome b subunit